MNVAARNNIASETEVLGNSESNQTHTRGLDMPAKSPTPMREDRQREAAARRDEDQQGAQARRSECSQAQEAEIFAAGMREIAKHWQITNKLLEEVFPEPYPQGPIG